MFKRLNQLIDSPRFLQVAVILLAVLLAVMIIQNQKKMTVNNILVNSPLDEIIVSQKIIPTSLKTLDGYDFNLSDLQSNYILLIFFDTDCPYCTQDIPLWQKMYEQGIVHNISILGITAETNANDVSEYARKNAIQFPLLFDNQHELFSQLKITMTPTKILLSSDWHVLQVWQGRTNQQSGQSDLGGIYAFFGIEPGKLPLP